MHPDIVRSQPGACPICGMDLVPQTSEGKVTKDTSLKALLKPANELVISDIATVKPEASAKDDSVYAKGMIAYDPQLKNIVSARINGRVERIYVRYNFQPVHKGQKLLDIYSPDLQSAQQDLLFLKDNGNEELLQRAKQRLLLLGVSHDQIARLLNTGKIMSTISVYSPYSGYLVEESSPALVAGASTESTSSGGMDAMGGAATSPAPSAGKTPQLNNALSLQSGEYVRQGQRMFNIVAATSVWAEFYVNPSLLDFFRKGSTVIVSSLSDENKVVDAVITMSQPFYGDDVKYAVLRAKLDNQGSLWKIGELITVNPVDASVQGNWVPRKAVLQLGSGYVVFVKVGDHFVPRRVQVKHLSNAWADVGDSVGAELSLAANAWFLVDTDSFVEVKQL